MEQKNLNIENFKKSKNELINKYNENVDKINLYSRRYKLMEDNKFETKTIGSLCLGLITYLMSAAIIVITGVEKIISVIPADILPILLLAGSSVISLLFKKVYEITHGLKEIKKFSSAKTYTEKLEEQLNYEIERAKLKNRNEAIEEALKTLKLNERYLTSFSQKYNIEKKKETTNNPSIEKEQKTLEETYEELDALTTKKILTTKFWSTRNKSNIYFDSILYGMLGGTLEMMALTVPFIHLAEHITYMNLISTLMMLAPAIGVTIGSVYIIRRNKNNMRIFNKFNTKLGKNAINDKAKDYTKDTQKYDSQIIDAINKLSIAEIALQEQKRDIELFNSENVSNSEKSLNSFKIENNSLSEEKIGFLQEISQDKLSNSKKRILTNPNNK